MEKRFLLLFSLMGLLIFGQINMASAQCDLVINMQDSYGDGWNGASVKVYDGATLLGTATIGNGYTGSATISAPDMTDISLVWTAGSYPEECGFTVINGIGIEVYVCEFLGNPAPGEFFVFTNVCSSVGLDVNLIDFVIPSKVAVGELEINGIVRSERDTPITSFDAVYSIDGVESDVATFDNLNIGFNETYEFAHTQLANMEVGEHDFVLNIQNINGEGDDDNPNNNSLTAQVLCVNEIFQKNVVYEEGTGTWCGWCPRGLVGLNTMAHNYTDGTWIGIGVHNGDPMTVPEYDQGIGTFIGGYPSGVMNRTSVYDPGLSSLEPAFLAARQDIPIAKIEVTAKTWDAGTGEMVVEATSNFAMDLTGTSYNVAMVIVENGVTGTTSQWNQANYYSGGGNGDLIDWDGTNWADLPSSVPAADMVYNHVGRVLVGGWNGISGIIPADVTYGTPYTYEFTHTLSANFDPAEVNLVVMLIDATTGIIVNASEVTLEGGAILSPDFSADVINGLAPLEVNFTDETVGGSVATWSWDFDNDGTEDSNEQNPSFTYVDGGDFTVSLTVTNETGDSFTITKEAFIHSSGVGLNELAAANFKCYPNPVQDKLYISYELKEAGQVKASVHSLTGSQLMEINTSDINVGAHQLSFDTRELNNGVYFLQLEINGNTITKKFSVVK